MRVRAMISVIRRIKVGLSYEDSKINSTDFDLTRKKKSDDVEKSILLTFQNLTKSLQTYTQMKVVLGRRKVAHRKNLNMKRK